MADALALGSPRVERLGDDVRLEFDVVGWGAARGDAAMAAEGGA